MEWIGSGERVPRALALVWYDPDAREWHIGQTIVARQMLDDIDLQLAYKIVGRQIKREANDLVRAIVSGFVLKDVAKGW